MRKYYNILEISETKDKKIIKKAYAKMVKKYRPENEPIKFQEIRDAYDNIIDYLEKQIEEEENKFSSVVDDNTKNEKKENTQELVIEEENYIEKAQKYTEEKLYDKAIHMYKKALLKSKENTQIINAIGVLYYHMDDIDKAINSFNKAIAIDDSSHITYSNLAQLYMRDKQYDLSRKNYIKAYDIEKNTNYLKGVLNTYKFSRQGEALLKALSECDLNKEEIVSYYIECIRFAVEKCANFFNEDNIEYLKNILDEISNEFLNTDYALDICDGLYKTASLLFNNDHYELASLLVEYGIKIYKTPEIKHLENKISEYRLSKQKSKIKKSERRIHPSIKQLVLEINNNTEQSIIDNLLLNIEQINIKDFVSQVEVIKVEYGLLYEKSKGILQMIEKHKRTKSQQKKIVYLIGLVLILLIVLRFVRGY